MILSYQISLQNSDFTDCTMIYIEIRTNVILLYVLPSKTVLFHVVCCMKNDFELCQTRYPIFRQTHTGFWPGSCRVACDDRRRLTKL
jgi:hypothetical protein